MTWYRNRPFWGAEVNIFANTNQSGHLLTVFSWGL
jgi:hypothetical protein